MNAYVGGDGDDKPMIAMTVTLLYHSLTPLLCQKGR